MCRNKGIRNIGKLSICVFGILCFISGCHSIRIRYASNTECDRYSLDALYSEKYKPITVNIFKDTSEFVKRVADLTAESLTSTMASMPNRDASDNEERKVHGQFKSIKAAFTGKIKKVHKNITAIWEDLVTNNFDLLYDNDKCTIYQYLNKTLNLTDAYKVAKEALDTRLGSFVTFIKGVVRDGLQGISYAANDALKKDAEKKKEEDSKSTEEEKENEDKEVEKEETHEEKLINKKVEIIQMVVSGFLKNISIEVVKQKVDLFKKITTKPTERDSVMDDVMFDMILIKNRMQAIIHEDIPKEKGSIDLARRSVYTYWAELAEKMYAEKLESKKKTTPGGDLYYQKLWSDENTLMETLLNLFDVYP